MAISSLAGAVLLEIQGEWAVAERRYLTEGSMALLDGAADAGPTKELNGAKRLLLLAS